jgi:hypothetical protein
MFNAMCALITWMSIAWIALDFIHPIVLVALAPLAGAITGDILKNLDRKPHR